MANGGADRQLQIRCLRPELLPVEEFESITDSKLLERTLVPQEIGVTSPLSTISGEDAAYYYGRMQLETCATPMGLGMVDGDIVAVWNPSKLPKGWDGKRRKGKRDRLKERIVKLTTNRGTEEISRGLNPVMGGSGGFLWPQELVSHGPACTSKQEIRTVLQLVAGYKTPEELERQKLLEEVEWEVGYSATLNESHPTLRGWDQEMWVKDCKNENKDISDLIERVTFILNLKYDGKSYPPIHHTVTSWPFRMEGPVPLIPNKIILEILIREPFASLLPGHDGLIRLDHKLADNDIDDKYNMKWNRIVEIGNNLKEGEFKNICEIIYGLPTQIRQSLLAGCSLDQMNMSDEAMSKDAESKEMQNTLKYCAGLNNMCITDLLSSNVSTRQYITGEWANWALYVGPVRNGISLDQKSPLPIVQLAPHIATGTVDNLVQLWKHYVAKEGFRLPKDHSCVSYNGRKIEVGSNTNVMDIIDRSMKKHYFAILAPGDDPRNINELLNFIEGVETGAERKKKKKRRKPSLKETPEVEADKDTVGDLEEIKIDRSNSDGSVSRNHDDAVMKSKNCKRRAKSGQLLEPEEGEVVESQIHETEQGSKEEDVNLLHEGEHDKLGSTGDLKIQALKDEMISKEAKLEELWESSRALVDSRGKEMSFLLSAVEDAEEEKHSMLKEVTGLEVEMDSIKNQLASIEEKRDQLVKNVKEKDEILNELLKKKQQLEELIVAEDVVSKQSKEELEKDLGSLQARIDASTKNGANTSDTVDKTYLENQRFLENINKKIEAKESDLECPVCLEVSSTPIYSCDEQHIICSDCRPKVGVGFKSENKLGSHTPLVLGQNLSRM